MFGSSERDTRPRHRQNSTREGSRAGGRTMPTWLSGPIGFVAAVVFTSMLYEALLAISIGDGNRRYWARLGPDAAEAVKPASVSARFAILVLAVVVVLGPIVSIAWGFIGLHRAA